MTQVEKLELLVSKASEDRFKSGEKGMIYNALKRQLDQAKEKQVLKNLKNYISDWDFTYPKGGLNFHLTFNGSEQELMSIKHYFLPETKTKTIS